ncbi:hypothetical protein IF984_004117 [Escherichia coli]|nr:hypothetical protein [Escherichia coli]ELZ5564411.1 hypothetical protein [Escherichia coli]HBV9072428.1 hypothetical protein [Escherichia coli]
MSLLNDVQKFIEAHPGCTSGDIADAFAGYSRLRVLQSASKLRQSGRVAHRCEGDTRRHFPRLPTGAFFAGAIAVFDKTWKGPAISYIGRDELEACGEAFLVQVRQQAEKRVREMAA